MIEPALYYGSDEQPLLRVYIPDDCGAVRVHDIEVGLNCLCNMAEDSTRMLRRMIVGNGKPIRGGPMPG